MVIQVFEAIPGWKVTPFIKALPVWKLDALTPAEMTAVIVPAPGDRVNTHAVPVPAAPGPPTMAVLPSPDSATEAPSYAWPRRRGSLATSRQCLQDRPQWRYFRHAIAIWIGLGMSCRFFRCPPVSGLAASR